MKTICAGLSPALSATDRERIQRLVDFWNVYMADGDSGETTKEVLEELQREVTDCLYRDPPDINLAERWTARAFHLIEGWDESKTS
jgi:hypothetical protein